MLKRDLFSGIFFLFVGAFFLFGSFRHPIWDRYGPGPGFFPLVLGLVFSILCLILLGGRIIEHIRHKEDISSDSEVPEFKERGRFLWCLGLFVCFYLSFESLGFVITVFAYLLVMLYFLGKRSFKLSFSISAISCVFVYLVFVHALGVQLPLGVLRDFVLRHLM